jgi:hypothetical protein
LVFYKKLNQSLRSLTPENSKAATTCFLYLMDRMDPAMKYNSTLNIQYRAAIIYLRIVSHKLLCFLGIRQKEILDVGKNRATIRKDIPIAHGFRKFFTTQLIEADLKTELRWLLEGHNLKANDSHYIRTTEKRLQQEYEKATDNLTIDPANRLQRKVETLTIEKSRVDKLEEKIRRIEKMYQK